MSSRRTSVRVVTQTPSYAESPAKSGVKREREPSSSPLSSASEDASRSTSARGSTSTARPPSTSSATYTAEYPIKCEQCEPPKWFKTVGYRSSHLRKEHVAFELVTVAPDEVYRVARTDGVFQCPFCLHSSFYANWLNEHYWAKRKEKGRQCRLEDNWPPAALPANWTRIPPDQMPRKRGPTRERAIPLDSSPAPAKKAKVAASASISSAPSPSTSLAHASPVDAARRTSIGRGVKSAARSRPPEVPSTPSFSALYWSSPPVAPSTASPRRVPGRFSTHASEASAAAVDAQPIFSLPPAADLPLTPAQVIEAQGHVDALNRIFSRLPPNGQPVGSHAGSETGGRWSWVNPRSWF